MVMRDEFIHAIVLPMANSIHETLIAFLQTSDFGTWHADDTKSSTQFLMHFVRGNWRKTLFGLGVGRVPGICVKDRSGQLLPETKPMLLEIAIRPSPKDLDLSIRFSVFSKNSLRGRKLQDYKLYWQWRVQQEVHDLRTYLEKCYERGY
jgi:hypothetical protein